jgi:hypothetical protein
MFAMDSVGGASVPATVRATCGGFAVRLPSRDQTTIARATAAPTTDHRTIVHVDHD